MFFFSGFCSYRKVGGIGFPRLCCMAAFCPRLFVPEKMGRRRRATTRSDGLFGVDTSPQVRCQKFLYHVVLACDMCLYFIFLICFGYVSLIRRIFKKNNQQFFEAFQELHILIVLMAFPHPTSFLSNVYRIELIMAFTFNFLSTLNRFLECWQLFFLGGSKGLAGPGVVEVNTTRGFGHPPLRHVKKNCWITLPETNSSHLKKAGSQKETIVFQPSIFRVYVSLRECLIS